MNALDDPIVIYIEEEKRALRHQFREKKAAIDEVYAKVAELEKELGNIKEKLAYTDELLNKRLRDSNQKQEGPPQPYLGRFSEMGPTQAVRALFNADPDQALSAPQIADLLVKEGFKTTSQNLSSIIFTICKRLEDGDHFLESTIKINVRYFRKKK